jgi:glutamate dehydrogenase/leucine dehydrogenase
MLVAIAGAGNVGLFIANELVDGANEVLLIENDLEVVKRIPPREGITVCAADACVGLTSSWLPPATTRTTSSCRCSPSRSLRCRG